VERLHDSQVAVPLYIVGRAEGAGLVGYLTQVRQRHGLNGCPTGTKLRQATRNLREQQQQQTASPPS
jgi:hypothetical protein